MVISTINLHIYFESPASVNDVIGFTSGRVEIWNGSNTIVPLGDNHNHNIILDIYKGWYKNPFALFFYISFILTIIYLIIKNQFFLLSIFLFVFIGTFTDLVWRIDRADLVSCIISSISIYRVNDEKKLD